MVVAIIGILAAFTMPAFNSIGQAKGTTEAAFQVASAVELARSEAVSRNAYVWLGVSQVTNAGNLDLRLALAYSTEPGPNTSALRMIGKPVIVRSVKLVSSIGLNVGAPSSDGELAGNNQGISFQSGQTAIAGQTITFTPLGEAMLKGVPDADDGFVENIGIGLRQARGTTEVTNNPVVIAIDGSVAIPQIFGL